MRTVGELIRLRVARKEMTYGEEVAYVGHLFNKYEAQGFAREYKNVTGGYNKNFNGKAFKVVRRMEARNSNSIVTLYDLPLWEIELENGVRICATPEEICYKEN